MYRIHSDYNGGIYLPDDVILNLFTYRVESSRKELSGRQMRQLMMKKSKRKEKRMKVHQRKFKML